MSNRQSNLVIVGNHLAGPGNSVRADDARAVVARAHDEKAPGRLKQIVRRSGRLIFVICVGFATYSGYMSWHYGVSFLDASRSIVRQGQLEAIRLLVWTHDPCAPCLAKLGPDCEPTRMAADRRVESVLPPGKTITTTSGHQIKAEEIYNERIIEGRGRQFRYQPFGEPRLATLRDKYHLDDVVAGATDELHAMVLLRNWSRSQFRRQDYQLEMPNFDALEILDRGDRNHGQPCTPGRHYDPCHFFPMLYCQVMLSMGYQARLVSNGHGMVEVWSNQHRKWILMDAELNHYFEKDNIPLNMVELLDENYTGKPCRVRIIRGVQTSGDENTTMVFLGVPALDVDQTIPTFNTHFDLVDLRNDWMTNHYFPGHPMRSEGNGIVYSDSRLPPSKNFAQRTRPKTSDRNELYWTLNQAEMFVRSDVSDTLDLEFRTITPNFKCFEIVIDGKPASHCQQSCWTWALHEGENTLAVRPVNLFNVQGIESHLKVQVTRTVQPVSAK